MAASSSSSSSSASASATVETHAVRLARLQQHMQIIAGDSDFNMPIMPTDSAVRELLSMLVDVTDLSRFAVPSVVVATQQQQQQQHATLPTMHVANFDQGFDHMAVDANGAAAAAAASSSSSSLSTQDAIRAAHVRALVAALQRLDSGDDEKARPLEQELADSLAALLYAGAVTERAIGDPCHVLTPSASSAAAAAAAAAAPVPASNSGVSLAALASASQVASAVRAEVFDASIEQSDSVREATRKANVAAKRTGKRVASQKRKELERTASSAAPVSMLNMDMTQYSMLCSQDLRTLPIELCGKYATRTHLARALAANTLDLNTSNYTQAPRHSVLVTTLHAVGTYVEQHAHLSRSIEPELHQSSLDKCVGASLPGLAVFDTRVTVGDLLYHFCSLMRDMLELGLCDFSTDYVRAQLLAVESAFLSTHTNEHLPSWLLSLLRGQLHFDLSLPTSGSTSTRAAMTGSGVVHLHVLEHYGLAQKALLGMASMQMWRLVREVAMLPFDIELMSPLDKAVGGGNEENKLLVARILAACRADASAHAHEELTIMRANLNTVLNQLVERQQEREAQEMIDEQEQENDTNSLLQSTTPSAILRRECSAELTALFNRCTLAIEQTLRARFDHPLALDDAARIVLSSTLTEDRASYPMVASLDCAAFSVKPKNDRTASNMRSLYKNVTARERRQYLAGVMEHVAMPQFGPSGARALSERAQSIGNMGSACLVLYTLWQMTQRHVRMTSNGDAHYAWALLHLLLQRSVLHHYSVWVWQSPTTLLEQERKDYYELVYFRSSPPVPTHCQRARIGALANDLRANRLFTESSQGVTNAVPAPVAAAAAAVVAAAPPAAASSVPLLLTPNELAARHATEVSCRTWPLGIEHTNTAALGSWVARIVRQEFVQGHAATVPEQSPPLMRASEVAEAIVLWNSASACCNKPFCNVFNGELGDCNKAYYLSRRVMKELTTMVEQALPTLAAAATAAAAAAPAATAVDSDDDHDDSESEHAAAAAEDGNAQPQVKRVRRRGRRPRALYAFAPNSLLQRQIQPAARTRTAHGAATLASHIKVTPCDYH